MKNVIFAVVAMLFVACQPVDGEGSECELEHDEMCEELSPTDIARLQLRPGLAEQAAVLKLPTHILTSPTVVPVAGWPQVSAPTAWRYVGGNEYTQENANLYMSRNIPAGYTCPVPAQTATGVVCTFTNGSKSVYQCPSHARIPVPVAYSLDGAKTFKYDFTAKYESERPILAVSRIEIFKGAHGGPVARCAYPATLRRIKITVK